MSDSTERMSQLTWPHEALAIGLVATIRKLMAEGVSDSSITGRATQTAMIAAACEAYSSSQAILAQRTAKTAWQDSKAWSDEIDAPEPPESIREGISRRTGDALAIDAGMIVVGGVVLSAAYDSLAASEPSAEDAAEAITSMQLKVRTPAGERDIPLHVTDVASDGWQDIVQGYRDYVGNRVGYRSVQISAHAACAEDHLPYQGRVYTSLELAMIQETLERPIGMWNCRHIMTPCPDGAQSSYSDEQIAEMRRQSQELVDVHGKQMTRYKATQWQRRREARIRKLKSDAGVFDSLGLDTRAADARRRARELTSDYRAISSNVGLRADERKLRVSYIGGFWRPKGLTR